MNARLVFRIIGLILLLEAAALLAPMLVSIFYKEWAWRAFLFSSLITATVGGTLYFVFKKAPRGLHAREAFALTGFSWLLLSVFGSLPSLISGDVASPYDALFETISGFTTTGASTLNSMEALSNGLLFWRSLTIWIGGMGFLLLFLALLPSLGEKSIQLLRAESPGPNPSKIVPRISDTARILYIIYTLLTLLTIFCFYLAGVPFFDSVVHALSTAGTGGFSSKNLSIGAFDLTAVHLVAAGFMLLFGINFVFFFHLIKRRFTEVKNNSEVWVYLSVAGGATVLITLNIAGTYAQEGKSVLIAVRDAFFSVSSLMTTTGFTTADYNVWPHFSKAVLILLMVFGACAGSTGGGVKITRIILLIKGIYREIKKIVHPRSVNLVKEGGRVVSEDVLTTTTQFFSAYVLLLCVGTLVLSFDGFGFEGSVAASITCLSNVGPGMDWSGPGKSFAELSDFSKCTLSMLMLIGRLEIFPVLVLLAPSTWKKN